MGRAAKGAAGENRSRGIRGLRAARRTVGGRFEGRYAGPRRPARDARRERPSRPAPAAARLPPDTKRGGRCGGNGCAAALLPSPPSPAARAQACSGDRPCPAPAPPPCPAPFNLAAHVLGKADILADKIALSVLGAEGCEDWTYGALAAAVRGTGTGLLQAGLEPGQIVLMRLGNSVEFPIA